MTDEAEFTYVLRFEPEIGRACKTDLDVLDDRMQAAGIGQVDGTIDMGGLDFVAMVDLVAANHLPKLKTLLVELGLADKCSLEEAQEADDDDWDDDDDDWGDDEDEEDGNEEDGNDDELYD
jgi:hypothetical protein